MTRNNRNLVAGITLLVGVVLTAWLYLHSSPEGTPILLNEEVPDLGRTFHLSLVEYIPPMLVKGGKLEENVPEPYWFGGFRVTNAQPALPYSEFVNGVSEEYIRKFDISPQRYAELTSNSGGGTTTLFVWYSLKMKCALGEFCYVVQSLGENGRDLTMPNPDDLALTFLKKDGRSWKVLPTEAKSPVMLLPWNDIRVIKSILAHEAAMYRPGNKLSAPP